LELLTLVLDLIYKYFEFNPGTVLRVDEGIDDSVELMRPVIQVHIQVPKFPENKLFSLPVFQKEQSNQILRSQLNQLLSGHDLFLAEVVFEHEPVHRRIKLDLEICVALEFVLFLEDFNDLS
jgi:hypothetical protein